MRNRRMFVGLALIFIGVVLLLEKLDVIHGGLGRYWPVVLIILGVGSLLRGRGRAWRWHWHD